MRVAEKIRNVFVTEDYQDWQDSVPSSQTHEHLFWFIIVFSLDNHTYSI